MAAPRGISRVTRLIQNANRALRTIALYNRAKAARISLVGLDARRNAGDPLRTFAMTVQFL